ncbi:hypothetical protein P9112_003084 [Eukaryota sp. TZLM1-RC]
MTLTRSLQRLVHKFFPLLYAAKQVGQLAFVWQLLFSLVLASHLLSLAPVVQQLPALTPSISLLTNPPQSSILSSNIEIIFWAGSSILIFVFVCILISTKSSSFTLPYPLLFLFHHIYTGVSTWLFLPLLNLFSFYATCGHVSTLDLCFTGVFVLKFVLSLIAILLLIFLSIISMTFYFDHELNSQVLLARSSSSTFFYFMAICLFSKSFELLLSNYQIQLMIILLIFSYFAIKSLILHQPFYNPKSNDFITGLFFVFGYLLILSFFSSVSTFLYFISIAFLALGIVVSCYQRTKKLKPLQMITQQISDQNQPNNDLVSTGSLNSIDSMNLMTSTAEELDKPQTQNLTVFDSEHQVALSLRVLYSKGQKRSNIHTKNQLYKKRSFLKRNFLPLPPDVDGELETKNFGMSTENDTRGTIANEVLRLGLDQFNNSLLLPIKGAFVSIIYLRNPSLAFSQLQRAKRSNNQNFGLLFEYFCTVKLRETVASQEGHNELSGDVILEFNRLFRSARRKTIDCQRTISNFWSILLDDVPDPDSLLAQMRKISQNQSKADAAFSRLLTRFPSNVQALRTYATYLHDIKKEEGRSSYYLSRADDVDGHNSQEKSEHTGTATGTNLSLSISSFDIDEQDQDNNKQVIKEVKVSKSLFRIFVILIVIITSCFVYSLFSTSQLIDIVDITNSGAEASALTSRIALFSEAVTRNVKSLALPLDLDKINVFPSDGEVLTLNQAFQLSLEGLRERIFDVFYFQNSKIGSESSVWNDLEIKFYDGKFNRSSFLLDSFNSFIMAGVAVKSGQTEFNSEFNSYFPELIINNFESLGRYVVEAIQEFGVFYYNYLSRIALIYLFFFVLAAISTLLISFLVIKPSIQKITVAKKRILNIFYAIPKIYVAKLARSLDQESEEEEVMNSGDDISDSELQEAEGKKKEKKPVQKRTAPVVMTSAARESERKVLVSQHRTSWAGVMVILFTLILIFGFVFLLLFDDSYQLAEISLLWETMASIDTTVQKVFDRKYSNNNMSEVKNEIFDHVNLSLELFSKLKFKYSLIGRSYIIDDLFFNAFCFNLNGAIDCNDDDLSLEDFNSNGIDDLITRFLNLIWDYSEESQTKSTEDDLFELLFVTYESAVRPAFYVLSYIIHNNSLSIITRVPVAFGVSLAVLLFTLLVVRFVIYSSLVSTIEKESHDTISLLKTIPDSVIEAVPLLKSLLNSTDELEEVDTDRLLKDNESRTNSILSLASDAIITSTETGVIESFNEAAEKIFGYPASEVIGENVTLLMPEEHAKVHHQYMNNYLTTGRKKVIGSGRLVTGVKSDGTFFPALLTLSEIKLADGSRHFCAYIKDYTEYTQMENRIKTLDIVSKSIVKESGLWYVLLDKASCSITEYKLGQNQPEGVVRGSSVNTLFPNHSLSQLSCARNVVEVKISSLQIVEATVVNAVPVATDNELLVFLKPIQPKFSQSGSESE